MKATAETAQSMRSKCVATPTDEGEMALDVWPSPVQRYLLVVPVFVVAPGCGVIAWSAVRELRGAMWDARGATAELRKRGVIPADAVLLSAWFALGGEECLQAQTERDNHD